MWKERFWLLFFGLILGGCALLFSCAKNDSSSKESSVEVMSNATIEDGYYKLTGASQSVYFKNSETFAGLYLYQINHDSSVSPGYFSYRMQWQGDGIYRVTIAGKATMTWGSGSTTTDCTTNTIFDIKFDSQGNEIEGGNLIQSGCGGLSADFTVISNSYTPISGGMKRYLVLQDSTNEYRINYTFLKQTTSTKVFSTVYNEDQNGSIKANEDENKYRYFDAISLLRKP